MRGRLCRNPRRARRRWVRIFRAAPSWPAVARRCPKAKVRVKPNRKSRLVRTFYIGKKENLFNLIPSWHSPQVR